MLRKIVNNLPLVRLTNNTNIYYFSQNQKQKQQIRNKSLKSSLFEQEMIQYAIKLESATNNLKKSGIQLSPYFKVFNFFTNKVNKQRTYEQLMRKSQNLRTDQQNQTLKEKIQSEKSQNSQNTLDKRKLLFYLITATFFVAVVLMQDQKPTFNQNIINSGKIINQNEMISLLSSGAVNQQIIIVREYKNKNPLSQHSYQTICIAKQTNKASAPKLCMVNNLGHFLTKIQSIQIPYNISFAYNADEPKQHFQFPLGPIIMIGLFYLGYKFFKNNNPLKMQLDQGLNLKKYQPIKPQQIKTYFKDVAGMHEAKQEITQFVDFLKNPDKYIEMGAKIPKGALLTGPPGTGKTLLARACAGEAGVPFFYVSGSQFVEKYVGLGANRVRSLFESAAKAAPSIIFIDEIDAIGKKRNSGPFSNEQKENTLNQMLVNMDGFDSKNKIIVMAATNLKDSLDPALLRPGRFDRSIEINLPNFQERIQILKVHLQKVTFSKKYTIEELAKKISVLTPGFSGAELANICNEAAILAARDSKKYIELPEFQKATERVMAGLQKRNLFTEQEKQCLAYYECGKAVAAWFTQAADPVIKISIAPYSKSSTGYSHEIKDEMPLKTRSELLSKTICYLAGRMAEQHFKGYTTNNGDKDLKKAKRILTFMVSKFGMSNLVGRIGFPDIQYMRKPYSEQTQSKIDNEVKRLFDECQEKARKLIISKVQQIEKLKKLILQKQNLTHNALKEVLGQRPFSDNQNYQKFLKDSQDQPKVEEEITVTPAPQ